MTGMPIAARLAAVIVAAVLAASVLTISLDYVKFRRVLRAQEDQVYLFVARDLAATIEDTLNLGLPLATLQTTGRMIQRRRASERGTLGISVFDASGTVLFDTDRFRLGRKLPGDWAPERPDQEWRAELPEAYLVGAPVRNSFNQVAGGVAVRYERAGLQARMNAILLDMLRAGLAAVAGCALAAVAAAALLTRRYRGWFAQATRQVDESAPGAAKAAPAPGSEKVMASIAATAAALDEAERGLMALGTGAVAAGVAAGAQPGRDDRVAE